MLVRQVLAEGFPRLGIPALAVALRGLTGSFER
jgi:hypothetical protein